MCLCQRQVLCAHRTIRHPFRHIRHNAVSVHFVVILPSAGQPAVEIIVCMFLVSHQLPTTSSRSTALRCANIKSINSRVLSNNFRNLEYWVLDSACAFLFQCLSLHDFLQILALFVHFRFLLILPVVLTTSHSPLVTLFLNNQHIVDVTRPTATNASA